MMNMILARRFNRAVAVVAGVTMGLCALAAHAADVEAQDSFASPEKAVIALKEAVKTAASTENREIMQRLFGPELKEIVNPDQVQRKARMEFFAKRMDEKCEIEKRDNGSTILKLGNDGWTFPIPLIQRDGKWSFDTAAGKAEILRRRIDQNELSAIEVCRAYVQAQRDYATKDCAGTGVMEYAQKLASSPGKRDGLYYETAPGEEESPFGPLVAKARGDGYKKHDMDATDRQPFHGYFFDILTKQGKNAPGGKYNYIINDHMVAGFALIAYPAERGNSGGMTFIVNQQGKVYQKDLGEKTPELVKEIKEYDPDDTWAQVCD